MHPSFIRHLVCPADQSELNLLNATFEGEFIRSGELRSASGKSYPIREFIPRFTSDDYANNFSVEWEKHPDILHQLSSNMTMYRTRFNDETKWPQNLENELVLEAGCGPGALTPFSVERGATVISLDLSSSVDQARQIVKEGPRNLFVQASMFAMPFRPGMFDRCFCFGVIQHTPDPAQAFAELVKVLRPGGHLAADSYIRPDPQLGGGHKLLRAKYRFRRLGLNRLPPRLLHLLVKAYVTAVFPFHRRLAAQPDRVEMFRSLMLDDYKARLTGMDLSRHKEFAVLDIFDFLSPAYDFPQSVDEFRDLFAKSGLTDIDVHPGYNGIEGRGRKV
ncbi:class I SAM-dependent methyltransferase [Methylobacterium mesophilicum]